jgi:hypothetical protein
LVFWYFKLKIGVTLILSEVLFLFLFQIEYN